MRWIVPTMRSHSTHHQTPTHTHTQTHTYYYWFPYIRILQHGLTRLCYIVFVRTKRLAAEASYLWNDCKLKLTTVIIGQSRTILYTDSLHGYRDTMLNTDSLYGYRDISDESLNSENHHNDFIVAAFRRSK